MLENTWKIAKFFTIFEKGSLMRATIAGMKGLKHARLSRPLKRANPNTFFHPFLKIYQIPPL